LIDGYKKERQKESDGLGYPNHLKVFMLLKKLKEDITELDIVKWDSVRVIIYYQTYETQTFIVPSNL
jgi:hypothetical protein